MNLLSRPEEYVLLAVWKLQDQAYSLPIRKQLSQATGYEWSLGSIFTPLERLAKNGYLTSYFSEATAERGGRHKRIYQLTLEGRRQLLQTRAVDQTMWAGVAGLALEG